MKKKKIRLTPLERSQTCDALASLDRGVSHPWGGEFDSPDREAILLKGDPSANMRDSDLASRITILEATVAKLTRQSGTLKSPASRMPWPADHSGVRLRVGSPLGKQ